MNPINQRLIERYGTLSLLGAGGMGMVYRAFDASRGIDVAIKQVHTPFPVLLERLRREAQVLKLISHPNVCPILEWCEEADAAWTVMPVLDGVTLEALIPELSIDQIVELLRQACTGVEAVHAQGLVHRDLKPANIMVVTEESGELRALVMDFGIARIDTESTLTGTHEVLGTPAYMAPEQARGDTALADARADVWGLGATLYCALTGAPPFGLGSLAQVMARVLDDDVVSPRVLRPLIPEPLARICLKALERSLASRYPSVAEFRLDLERYQQGSVVEAPRFGPWRYLRRMLARHPRFWASLGLLALLAIGAAGVAVWTTLSSAERSAAARELAALDERVSAGMRAAKLAPLHDINHERAPLLADIEALLERYRGAPAALRLDLDRSLTDAFHELGQLTRARPHAERLLQAPAPTDQDRLRYARIALGQHAQALPAAMALPDGSRELALESLRSTHVEPAMRALGQLPVPPLLSARLALAESNWDLAEAALAEYRSDDAADYQQPQLAGEIRMARASARMTSGDLRAAERDFEAAAEQYRQALQIARTEPALLARLCQLSSRQRALDSILGESAQPVPEQLDPSCDQLLVADPKAVDTLAAIAAAWHALASAEDRNNQPLRAQALLRKAIAVAEQAVAADPSQAGSRLQLARSLSLDAALMADDYAAARRGYDRAVRELEAARAVKADDAGGLLALGDTLRNRGKLTSNQGSQASTADGLADYAAARQVLERAIELRPQALQPRRSLSLTLMFSFYAQRADEAQAVELAQAAIATLDPLLKSYPEHPDLLFDQAANLGDYWVFLASVRAPAELADTLAVLDRCLSLFAQLRSVAPARPDGYEFELGFRAQAGESLRVAGLPNRDYLEPVPALIVAADTVGLQLAEQYVGWALTERAMALAAVADPSAEQAFAQALSVLERGLADPQSRYDSVRMLLQWSSARAGYLSADPQQRRRVLARGEALFTQAVASERGQFDNILWCEGALLAYESGRGGAAATALQTALQRLDRCAELGPVYFKRWQSTREQIEAELAGLADTSQSR
jgi:eukaryotic-like serine/threonine-protein kinase